jgi:hypothetical protein
MKRIVCGLIGLSLLASVNLMAKEVPTKEVNVSVGKDVSNTLSDYVHYTENKELYMKLLFLISVISGVTTLMLKKN